MRTIALPIAAALAVGAPAVAHAQEEASDQEGFGANREASLSTREEHGLGGHSGRVLAFGARATGDDFTRGAGPKDYASVGGGVEFHYTANGDKTRFDTLLGFDLDLAAGYSALTYGDEDSGGGFVFRTDFGPTFGLLDFGGETTGARLTFLPAMGLSFDDERFYGTYAYFSLGARLSAHLGEATDAHLQYVFVPGTTTDTWLIREHRIEPSLNLGSVALGVRYHVVSVEQAAGDAPLSSKNPSLGLIVGYAF